jgi:hypothetical protein
MEPKISSPEMNRPQPERSPDGTPGYVSPEARPEISHVTPENRTSVSAPERAPEQAAQAQAAVSAIQTPVTLPTPVPIDDTSTSTTPADDLPAVAADEDLIEKEWVDKAKQIIAETRDNPAARERQVSKLQADYLKKRYGKELGEPVSE